MNAGGSPPPRAASYLRDLPLQEWSRRTSTPITWESFIRFLRNSIADPVNRMSTASLRLKKAEQKEGQSARAFASYIEELEEDIPDEMTEEERRAWVLLNGLKPSIRNGVLRENKTITSRAQVLSAAQRQEELLGEAEGETSETDERPGKRVRSAGSGETDMLQVWQGRAFQDGMPGKGKKFKMSRDVRL